MTAEIYGGSLNWAVKVKKNAKLAKLSQNAKISKHSNLNSNIA